MRALVQEHAAALALPGRAPAAAVVVGLRAEPGGDDPVHAGDLSELAALDDLAQLDVVRVGALVEHRGEDDLLVLVRRDEALAVGLVDRDGLLDERVDALRERVDADRRVVVVGRLDHDRVHLARADELAAVRELEVLVAVAVHLGRHDVADRGEPRALDEAALDVGDVAGAHVADADDADPDFRELLRFGLLLHGGGVLCGGARLARANRPSFYPFSPRNASAKRETGDFR